MEIITINDLTKALKNTFGRRGMEEEDIKSIAEFLINFFGFEEYAIDNRLNPEDRDVFYMLEEVGLLKTVREEVTIKKGQTWRIHYWKLNKAKIKELGEKKKKDSPEEGESFGVYEEINDKVWERSGEKDEE